MNLTPQQKRKLERLLKLGEQGLPAILEYLYELEDKIDSEIPSLKGLLDKVKGDKGDTGDTYELTQADKKQIASITRDLVDVYEVADIVLDKIDVNSIAKSIEANIVVPKPNLSKLKQEVLDSIVIPPPIKGDDGEDADEEIVAKKVEVSLIKDLPSFGEHFRDGLELLPQGQKLSINAIEGIEDYPEVARLARASQFLNRGGNGKGLLSQMNDVNIQSPTNNQVLKYNSTTSLWENGTGGGGGSGLNSFTSPDDSLVIGGTLTDPTAKINYAHSGTYTASQTFLEDTIFSDVAPLNGHELKLVSYLKDDVLYDASWTLGHGNVLSVADTNQVIVGNNNSMTGFLGFINGIGNTSTGTEDVFIQGMNNIVTGTSGGAVSGISNTLTNGSSVYVQGINNSTGAFSNQLISGLACSTSADNTAAVGLNLVNSLTNSLDIGMSDATKLTLSTSYAQFRTDVGIGTTPSAGLHILKTTEQLRLSWNASNDVRFTVSSGGLLSLQTTAGATAGVYTLTPHGAGGAGTNRTINFGAAYGNPALWLYNAGSSGTRYGWGMQNDTMQFFVATGAGKKFTFNYGGDLQSTGNNEILRLTQYGSGGGGLGMGQTATDPKTPHRIDFAGVTSANATVGTEDILRFSRIFNNGVSYPQAFTIAIGRYVAPTSFSPNTSIDFRLKDDSTNNITTNNGVMSLNSNRRVLIGGVGAATAILDLVPATTAHASLRIQAGTAPTSPNDGDIWYENTNDRLMFRKNATSSEILSASAVTTEVVVSDTTLTITYNGVTYKLLAKA